MRPYGYTSTLRAALIDEEADRLNAAADQALALEPLTRITAEFNARGYTTVTGRLWTAPALRRMLLNPYNAGLLEEGVPAPWPGAISPEKHARLVELLTDETRATGSPHPGRVYLLTGGVARCGLCDAPLISNPVSPGRRSYACTSRPRTGGCGRIRISGDALDEYVSAHVLARIQADMQGDDHTGAAFTQLRRDARAAREQATRAELALQSLAADYAAGTVSKEAFLKVAEESSRIGAEARALERMAAIDLPRTVEELTAWWGDASITQLRQIVEALIDKVEVHPVLVRGSKKFDERRVHIRWL